MSGVHSTLNMLVDCPNISFANQYCVAPGLNLQTHTIKLVIAFFIHSYTTLFGNWKTKYLYSLT